MTHSNFPIYEFRPLATSFGRAWDDEVRRYADGEWIIDDGEHDLAFVRGTTCLYVALPYQKNILWSWVTGHWSAFEPEHPRGNAWHYMLRDGEAVWGGNWGRDNHPNEKAGRYGMNRQSGIHGCANGTHVDFHLGDKHIAAGLVRVRDTKEVVRFPEKPCCMYCGDDAKALLTRCCEGCPA